MNMTNVLHRRKSAGAPDPMPPVPGRESPSMRPPNTGHRPPARWPASAWVIVALLTIVTVLAAVAAVVASSSADNGATERELVARIDSLTAERDDAVDAVGELDSEIASLNEELLDARSDGDGLTDRIVGLEARIASLTDERAEAVRTVDELIVERDEALAEADVLSAGLSTAHDRLSAAIADRDALAELFPIEFDASLDGAGLVGRHDVTLSSLYCSGLPSCGTAPNLDDATISSTSAGNLRLAIPNFVEGGLFAADGALHLVADSTTIVPACNGTARTADVVMTIFPGGYQITDDGARSAVGLNALITVETPAAAGCPAGLAFYRAALTPAR